MFAFDRALLFEPVQFGEALVVIETGIGGDRAGARGEVPELGEAPTLRFGDISAFEHGPRIHARTI